MTDRLPAISGTRIPYHPIVQERYGIAPESWRALTEAVFPTAQSLEGVILALSYCKSRNLDVFKRPVHIVPIWNNDQNRYVETVWPGIGELRSTAFRTGNYAGCDPARFGPDITREFSGQVGRGNNQRTLNVTVTFPEWCEVTVYRTVHGQIRPWPGPRVYWLETYSRIGRSEVPNDMWQKRPRGQLEKCAEAAALRKAFPEEIGEQYISDEISEDMKDITPAKVGQPEVGNGASADPMDAVVAQARQEAPQRSAAPPEREPASATPRKAGRPKKPETIAREIIAEIQACEPADVQNYILTRRADISALPPDVQDEIAAAAMERAASGEDDSPEAPADEAGWDDEEVRYEGWLAQVREQAQGAPTMGHVNSYRQTRLGQCDQWEDRQRAEKDVNDAFDARRDQLQVQVT